MQSSLQKKIFPLSSSFSLLFKTVPEKGKTGFEASTSNAGHVYVSAPAMLRFSNHIYSGLIRKGERVRILMP